MRLLRAFTTVSGMTMVSRLLGFVRDILFASILGAGPIADAFVAAFRLPNLFRRLFAEGAFNSAFVPLYARSLEHDGPTQATIFAKQVLAVLVTALIIFTAIAEVGMVAVVYIVAPGFADDEAQFALTVLMSRIMFPYLGFMSVVAFYSGILNAVNRFAAAAAAPVLLNILFICTLLILALTDEGATIVAGVSLAWTVAAAGVVQLLMLIWAANRASVGVTLGWPRLTDDVRRLFKLMIPGIISGGIVQINILISTVIASFQAGAVAYLYYAERVYQLPLGIVGAAFGVILLPELSRALRAGAFDRAKDSQNRALEAAAVLTLPATIGLLTLALPIVTTLFERGAFSSDDASASSLALIGFAFGLPAYILVKLLSPAYFARENTQTPMRFALISAAANILFSISLFPFIGYISVAIGTSIAGWINALLLFGPLYRQEHFVIDAARRKRLPRILMASIGMGAVLLGVRVWALPFFAEHTALIDRVSVLAILIVTGLVSYMILAILFGAIDRRLIRSILGR